MVIHDAHLIHMQCVQWDNRSDIIPYFVQHIENQPASQPGNYFKHVSTDHVQVHTALPCNVRAVLSMSGHLQW